MFLRRWVVTRVGSEGWGLRHHDQFGCVVDVPSWDPVGGDSLDQVRDYVAECGLPFDLFVEQDRAFVVLPRLERAS